MPKTLTEFSPFTPLTASSTLSLIICEKLKTTPGNASLSSLFSSSVSFSLVIPRGHSSNGFERREELDVVEAGDVGPVVGAAELRDDGR